MSNETTDLEAMSAEEIDAAVAELRRRQKESAPVKFPSKRGGGIWGGFGCGLSGGSGKRREELGLPDIDGDGFAADAENLRGDLERVGRDMWLGLLRHAKSAKNTPAR